MDYIRHCNPFFFNFGLKKPNDHQVMGLDPPCVRGIPRPDAPWPPLQANGPTCLAFFAVYSDSWRRAMLVDAWCLQLAGALHLCCQRDKQCKRQRLAKGIAAGTHHGDIAAQHEGNVHESQHNHSPNPGGEKLEARRKRFPPCHHGSCTTAPRHVARFAIVMYRRLVHDSQRTAITCGVAEIQCGQADVMTTSSHETSDTRASHPNASRIAVTNPATGDHIDEVDTASADDVARAVERARAAQEAWKHTSIRNRVAILRRFHDLVLARARDVLDGIQAESGKARRDAMTEIAVVTATARHYAAHGPSYLRGYRVKPAAPLITSARVEHVPRGVVGIISPWNYPFLMAVGDALPALLAGNAVVVKPSPLTPLSAELARDLLVQAGLDPDLFIVVHGDGAEAAQALISHVDFVQFTGSTETGRIVGESCARRLIPCSLELGGKNAMIVLDDADLDNAIWGAINGIFPNSGQSCISTERVFVHERIHDRFVSALVQRTAQLEVGWSTGWDVDMGSLISADHAASVAARVNAAAAQGADVLTPDREIHTPGSAFVTPTLLTGVTAEMDLFDHEAFGPVAAIECVPDAPTAIERANASSFGLHGVIWSGNKRATKTLARQLATGTVGINSTLLVYATPDVPMGGIKSSGIGRRHGREGIIKYTNPRSVVSSIGWKGGFESLAGALTTERRSRLLLGAFRAWNRIPGIR